MVPQTKTSVILILLACLLTVSCNNGNRGIATVDVDAEISPSLHSEDIISLISDSGITRYRLQTKVLDVYTDDTATYWHFPEKIHLEIFDSLFNVDSWVKADTAYYFETNELIKLIGNVFIQNQDGHKFETSELYLDQKEPPHSVNSIRTDSFVRIDQGDRIITSQGLRSNQSMTRYRLYSSSIEAIINDADLNNGNDSVPEPVMIEPE